MPERIIPSVLVIGNPHSNISTKSFLDKFITILSGIASRIIIVSGDQPSSQCEIVWKKTSYPEARNAPQRFVFLLVDHLAALRVIVSRRRDYDAVIILPTAFVIPSIVSRMCGKRVAVFVAQELENRLLSIGARINFRASNLLFYESESVLEHSHITRMRDKCARISTYVDTALFAFNRRVDGSQPIVGFVGGFERRKGILEFVEAIEVLNGRHSGLQFVIGGFGLYEQRVVELAARCSNVTFKGVVSREKLPAFLGELALLVVPSLSEGIPGIVLESMSCGAPVLASPAGGIPDIVQDGKTGFLMSDNLANTIADNIVRALSSPDLETISKEARRFIEENYTFQPMTRRYSEALERLLNNALP